jgi:hypothetical protein
MGFVEQVWERITGRPYWTGRSYVAEYGPTVYGRHPEWVDSLGENACYLSPREVYAAVNEYHAAARRAVVRRRAGGVDGGRAVAIAAAG